jgi:hypothetical protein
MMIPLCRRRIRTNLLLTIASFLGFARTAMAEMPSASTVTSAPRTGFEVAVRTGYARPVGNLRPNDGGEIMDYPGQIPVLVEVGARVVPHVFVGAYFGAGFGLEHTPGVSSTALHIGAEVQYHFVPEGGADPWLGYGLGYESLSENDFDERSTRFDGFEFGHLMGGANFRLNPAFAVGPFLDVSLGHYTSYHYRDTVEPSTRNMDRSIPGMAVHSWLTLGVRGTFGP